MPITPVLAGPEPPNQTGKKVTFGSQITQQLQQLRLWLPWVLEGYIHPFPNFVQSCNSLSNASKIKARTAVQYRFIKTKGKQEFHRQKGFEKIQFVNNLIN